MDKEKIILLIVGASIGFVVSLAKDWLMESKKQKEKEKKLKREKLERAFMILEDFNNKVTSIKNISLREGEYNSNELNMIIRFYFDDIYIEYQKYLNISIKYFSDIKEGKSSENQIKEYFNEYKLMVNLLVKESQKLS